ncbi:DNA polymerase III subunit gamma/tau [uncultured Bacteroides sp.]|uniref:DNA polymerase III subunit gamma/tau n=1 Tax=uncultured Bacteroides sp. TaxID=162156 RepID=UPI0025DAA543|nr:DNA polymerase III subunit gamma/tau [uncultured Bacteroides sp.]
MENYIVSARKYRPTTFESVVGQRALTTTLKNAIATGKLAHAYLFCGPRGVGKTTCARIFAKTINCMSPTADGEACNQCESCTAFNEQRSYNIHELDAASNNSVDDIRQLVEQVRIPPQIGKYKVYIIDEVHMLSASAFNAFLKTLEEPPRHAIFILATTEKHKILPTILSRCQIYDFNRINVDDTVAHLAYVASKEGITAEPEALNVIALKADGGMRDALSIFDQVVSFTGGHISYKSVIENLNVLDYEYYFRLTDHFLANLVSDALLLLNDVLNKGFDASHFVTGLSSHFRDLLVSKDPATLALLEVGASIRERYQAQAQKCPLPFLYRAMKLCNDCDLNYRASKNKRLLVELTLIQVAQLTAEGDDVSGGRRPKQAIKPIFSQPAAAQQPQGTSAMPQPQATTHAAPVQPQPAQQAPAAQAAPASPQSQQPFGSQTAMRPTPTAVLMAQGKEEKKIPVMKMSGLGISIKHPQVEEDKKQTAGTTTSQQNAQPEEDFIFNEKDVNYYWQEYAGRLPQEQTALAKRMQVIRLAMLDATTFEAVVDNDIAAKEFTDLIPTLQEYLRKRLKNSKATMTVRVSAPTEKVRAYSRVEKFQLMAQKNNALLQLKDEFGLELY